jgi:hypothetical protein
MTYLNPVASYPCEREQQVQAFICSDRIAYYDPFNAHGASKDYTPRVRVMNVGTAVRCTYDTSTYVPSVEHNNA